MIQMFVVMSFVLVMVACGTDKITNSPTPVSGTAQSSFDPTRAAAQQTGITSSGDGFVRFWGNLNSLETSIVDWNKAGFNLFVTVANRIHKYETEYGNSVVKLDGVDWPATILRTIDFGSSVRFELRIIQRGSSSYTQVTYGRRNDPKLFQLLPSDHTITSDFFTVGPVPTLNSSSTTSIGTMQVVPTVVPDWEIQRAPMPKHCIVPVGQTDCEAK